MKILYTLNSGNPGGMEQHVLDLVKGMVSEGNEVFVWCKEGPIVNWFEDAGATVYLADIFLDFDPLYVLSLISFLRSHKIDVIHSHELKASINSVLAGFLAGTKIRVTHTHTPISEWQISKLKRFINTKVYSLFVNLFSSMEIALTKTRKEVKMAEGIKEHKLFVIPNGLDIKKFDLSKTVKSRYRGEILSKYNISHDAFVFGNVSRVTVEKGQTVLINAFARLYKILPDNKKTNTYLLIAGGGDLEQSLNIEIKKLGLSKNIIITGRFGENDLVKFYSSFDAFVFPSLAEGFGIVLIEAMVSKLPVLCSDLPVLREVGGDTISYFVTNSLGDLTKKMSELFNDSSEAKLNSEKAYNRVVRLYSDTQFTKNYISLYNYLFTKK